MINGRSTPTARILSFGAAAALSASVIAAGGAALNSTAPASAAGADLARVRTEDTLLAMAAREAAGSERERVAAARASYLERVARKERLARKQAAAERASRAAARRAATLGTVIGTRYATTALKVRTAPSEDASSVDVISARTRVRITDVKVDGWRQISYGGKARWVAGRFLSRTKPAAASRTTSSSGGGISTAACASGSGVESGLTRNAIAVHRAVCARYPQITSYGGVRGGGGEHSQGRALDIMVSGSRGDDVAAWLRANASRLGISEVIWSQRIWTVQRSSEGWRWMEDRGSVTANHYDHVHVTVY